MSFTKAYHKSYRSTSNRGISTQTEESTCSFKLHFPYRFNQCQYLFTCEGHSQTYIVIKHAGTHVKVVKFIVKYVFGLLTFSEK